MNSKLVPYLRSALFFLGMVAVTVVWPPLVVLARVIPYRQRYTLAIQWSRFVIWWLKVTCGVRYEIIGEHNIPDQPTVVMCKHQSTWETIFLTLVFRPQVWVLKREILRFPFFGWGIGSLKPIAIDRGSRRESMQQVLQQGSERLREGCFVIIFPEGTRVPPGQRRRYGSGGAILAKQAGCAIIPVAHNAGCFWPKKGFLKHPGTVQVVIGEPFDTANLSSDQIRHQTEDWIENTMASLDQPNC